MKIRVLRKFSASNFALPDVEDNTLGPLNRKGIADLPFTRRIRFARSHMNHVSGKL